MITKKFGTTFGIKCANGNDASARIRGKFKLKVWMNINDIVLVDGSQFWKILYYS